MNFTDYKANFPYRGKSIYKQLFALNSARIKTKKETFAVNNLEKIFKATFKISSKIGFHEMSLRHLSRETGLSMGGIYSCIASKEVIALMVQDLVRYLSDQILASAQQQTNNQQAITQLITDFIYTTEILQPWFYFLYFETRSLPSREQQISKQIEHSILDTLKKLLATNNPRSQDEIAFTANTILAVIQERYLKPWKYKQADSCVDSYRDQTLQLAYAAIS